VRFEVLTAVNTPVLFYWAVMRMDTWVETSVFEKHAVSMFRAEGLQVVLL
jgi:hypothetical protein